MTVTRSESQPQWADIGVNLGDRQFRDDWQDVLKRAEMAGVVLILITGTTLEESRRAQMLAISGSPFDGYLYATAGIHPHYAHLYDGDTDLELEAMMEIPRTAAAGEMGLDFNRDFSPRADQEQAFEEQLEIAALAGKPVFLHERDAHERFLAILKPWRDKLPAAVVHCFTGDRRALSAYLDLDCYIGITGWVCDERRGRELAELVPEIPGPRLLLETDAPYLLPRDRPEPPPRKRRNEPALLPWIGQRVAALRGDTPDKVAAMTLENACRFLGVDLD